MHVGFVLVLGQEFGDGVVDGARGGITTVELHLACFGGGISVGWLWSYIYGVMSHVGSRNGAYLYACS